MKFRVVEEFSHLEENKRKKKSSPQVFNSIDELKRWVKERQKGLSPFCYLNPDAGNVEYNNDAFNHLTGADNGDFGSLSNSGNTLGGGESAGAGE